MTQKEFSNTITAFWDWLDNRGIIRRIVLAVAIYQGWLVTVWAMSFSEVSARPGIDIAAIIAAVSMPVSTFGGFVFKAYLESKST